MEKNEKLTSKHYHEMANLYSYLYSNCMSYDVTTNDSLKICDEYYFKYLFFKSKNKELLNKYEVK
jgi:hypothetical protein